MVPVALDVRGVGNLEVAGIGLDRGEVVRKRPPVERGDRGLGRKRDDSDGGNGERLGEAGDVFALGAHDGWGGDARSQGTLPMSRVMSRSGW